MKLKVGDIIEVIGWVMLKNLDSGKYKVARISKGYYGQDVYWFSKPKGKKEIVGHYASDVDMSMDKLNNNRIEIISSK